MMTFIYRALAEVGCRRTLHSNSCPSLWLSRVLMTRSAAYVELDALEHDEALFANTCDFQ